MAGYDKLTVEARSFLHEVARMAYGSGRNEGTRGGAGRMGVLLGTNRNGRSCGRPSSISRPEARKSPRGIRSASAWGRKTSGNAVKKVVVRPKSVGGNEKAASVGMPVKQPDEPKAASPKSEITEKEIRPVALQMGRMVECLGKPGRLDVRLLEKTWAKYEP